MDVASVFVDVNICFPVKCSLKSVINGNESISNLAWSAMTGA